MLDIIKKLNPLDNCIEFDSTAIKWKIDPKLKNTVEDSIKESMLMVEFKQDFKDADVELKVRVDGKIDSYTFQNGVDPLGFNINLKKDFKESDITIQLTIDGNTSIFTSPANKDSFRAKFSFTKKF